ncbi:MAG TPA: septum formation family protein [Acidimicrobiales bacterium]|nr:septum formation family protein [Acidimicrobiales bacterium]
MPARNRTLPSLASALVAGLLIAGLAACGSDEPERDESTNEITEAGDADVFSMQVGDCLTDQSATGEVTEVPVVPCSEPHASEIFVSHVIEADELPDATEMQGIVQEQCLGAFEGFVGMPYEQSVLEVTWLEPTAGSWDAGDRELLCIVQDPAGDVTGSLQGAAR